MYMATLIAHVTFFRVSIRYTSNEARIGWRWCGAMTGHGDNSAPTPVANGSANTNLCVANARANAIEIVVTGDGAV